MANIEQTYDRICFVAKNSNRFVWIGTARRTNGENINAGFSMNVALSYCSILVWLRVVSIRHFYSLANFSEVENFQMILSDTCMCACVRVYVRIVLSLVVVVIIFHLKQVPSRVSVCVCERVTSLSKLNYSCALCLVPYARECNRCWSWKVSWKLWVCVLCVLNKVKNESAQRCRLVVLVLACASHGVRYCCQKFYNKCLYT